MGYVSFREGKGCGFFSIIPLMNGFILPWKSPSPVDINWQKKFVGLKCGHDKSLQNKLLQNERKHDEESGIDVLGQKKLNRLDEF